MKLNIITKNQVCKIVEEQIKPLSKELEKIKKRVLELEIRFTDAGRNKNG